MGLVRAVYCTPRKAERLGRVITGKYTLSNQEAIELREFYKKVESGEAFVATIALGTIGLAISEKLVGLGFLIATSLGLQISTDFMETLDNDFDAIATNGTASTTIKTTFHYVRHGSSDGAYFLSGIEVI